MDFKTEFPDFAVIEDQITRARAERSVYLAHVIANFIAGISGGLRKLGDALDGGLAAERDRSAIEADAFLKRSVPRY